MVYFLVGKWLNFSIIMKLNLWHINSLEFVRQWDLNLSILIEEELMDKFLKVE